MYWFFFRSFIDNRPSLISCIQNDLIGETAADEDYWELTGRPDVQSLLGRMVINNCKKGILITNSSFSDEAIEFAIYDIKNFNVKNNNIISGKCLIKFIKITSYKLLTKFIYNIH